MGKKIYKVVLTCLVVSASILISSSSTVFAEPIEENASMGVNALGIIETGTFGTSDWSIDDAGVLHIQAGTFADTTGYKSPWDLWKNSISKITFEGDVVASERSARLFADLDAVEVIENLNRLDTSNVTDMERMFSGASSLTNLDVSGFDTSNVTDISAMFEGASSLTSLDVSGFDTSKVTNISEMFRDASSLTSLDVSGFDTSNVIRMSHVFNGASSLTSLDVSGFDTSNVIYMGAMFARTSSLTSLDVSGFDTSNVEFTAGMFSGVSNVTSLDVSGFDTSNVTDMRYMFSEVSSVTSLDVSGFDTSNVETMAGMFRGASSVTSLDVSGFDTSKVTDMYGMFFSASSLTSLDVSSFDTSNVIYMDDMFSDTSSLASLDLSSFDTSNVLYMDNMFSGTSSLASLSLGAAFEIIGDPSLPLITAEGYTGAWIGINNGVIFNSSLDFMDNFDGNLHADTYVWERAIVDLSNFEVSPIDNVVYNGTEYRPEPTVTDGATILQKDIDYTLSYANNTNAGIATVTITGIGYYSGEIAVNFTIEKAIPTVNNLPTATSIIKGETLAKSNLKNGSMNGVEGTFDWTNPTTVVNATGEYEVTFISNDPNYANTTMMVRVVVNAETTPADPVKPQMPYKGDMLPQTGDSSSVIGFSGLLLVAGSILLFSKRRKKV